MLAGETYNCLDADLEIERQKVKRLLRLYNLAEAASERQAILHQMLGRVGVAGLVGNQPVEIEGIFHVGDT
jgi:hypothetical protein